MNQSDPQFSEQRRGADVAFQQSLVQLETLIDTPAPETPEPPTQTSTTPSEQESPAWETAGADLEEFLEVDGEA